MSKDTDTKILAGYGNVFTHRNGKSVPLNPKVSALELLRQERSRAEELFNQHRLYYQTGFNLLRNLQTSPVKSKDKVFLLLDHFGNRMVPTFYLLVLTAIIIERISSRVGRSSPESVTGIVNDYKQLLSQQMSNISSLQSFNETVKTMLGNDTTSLEGLDCKKLVENTFLSDEQKNQPF